ncbi:hypothetical protein OOK43_14915 [[Kitasatospora] papulosa]|uniref:hypothetical protein n=1 Tax=[Kitasatospora] papulosa TaxID=1464011 RepID=UPI002259D4E8|nr:hypothetical protein [[Kitasatospora] papulosa]MCX4414567.1 hypothetical protein [[Kitasatospora] papulosa]
MPFNGNVVISDWNKNSPQSLNTLASRFAAQISAIVEISETVIPELEKKGLKYIEEVKDRTSRHLNREEKRAYKGGIEAFMAEFKNLTTPGKTSIKIDMPPAAALALAHYVQTAARYAYVGSREEVTRRALLVSLISNFEILFGKLARVVYEKNKAALNDSEYSFTLQQLSEFDSVEDAREFLIERRLSVLLRDSVDGWEKWLGRACGGLSMTAFPVDWPGIRESFARRNLIVHAESKVNQIYLDTVKDLKLPRETLPSKGESLKVSSEYLLESAERIMALGVILTAEITRKLHKKEGSAAVAMLAEEAEECARRGFWKASIAISGHALDCPSDRSQRIDIQTSNWLARKEIFGKSSIQEEVEAWDISGLSPQLSHRKRLLLDPESAVSEIEELLEQGELAAYELASNPLYEGVLGIIADRKESELESSTLNEITS